MKLFIDTNIYLNYFRGSDERLSSLEELKKLLKQNKLKLVLPAQTRDEYFRNRNGIAERSRDLLIQETELKLMLPAPFVKDWPEAAEVRKQVVATKKAYKDLLKEYDAKVSAEDTPADVLIKGLFANAEIFDEDEQLLRRAHFRYLRGHPPRKNDGSFGDAITWELLMAKTGDELVVISKDTDFSEKRRGETSLNGFLEKEWHAKYGEKTIKLYISLGEFINTFEKRVAVKEDVIEREKSPDRNLGLNAFLNYATVPGTFTEGIAPSSVVTGPRVFTPVVNTVFGTSLGSGSWIQGVGSTGSMYSGGGLIRGEYSPLHSQHKRMKFCPYCGNDIAAELPTFPTLTANKFTCPHCHSEFDPGGAS